MGRKSNIFKKTLNTRYFGRKTTFFDDSVSKPKRIPGEYAGGDVQGLPRGIVNNQCSVNSQCSTSIYADGKLIGVITVIE